HQDGQFCPLAMRRPGMIGATRHHPAVRHLAAYCARARTISDGADLLILTRDGKCYPCGSCMDHLCLGPLTRAVVAGPGRPARRRSPSDDCRSWGRAPPTPSRMRMILTRCLTTHSSPEHAFALI